MGKIIINFITKAQAISLHREMWTDMANYEKEHNIEPNIFDRNMFKKNWCEEHIQGEVKHNCFLCEFASRQKNDTKYNYCYNCPLVWKEGEQRRKEFKCERKDINWQSMDALEVANLKERENI